MKIKLRLPEYPRTAMRIRIITIMGYLVMISAPAPITAITKNTLSAVIVLIPFMI